MDEVEQICDRVGIIDRGAVLVEGTVDELRQSLGGRELVTLRGVFQPALVQLAFDGIADVAVVRATDDEVLLNVAGAASRLQALLGTASQLGEIREVLVSRPTLETLFPQAHRPRAPRIAAYLIGTTTGPLRSTPPRRRARWGPRCCRGPQTGVRGSL